jgi:hypothetical protein
VVVKEEIVGGVINIFTAVSSALSLQLRSARSY